jgi:hypothetical protein
MVHHSKPARDTRAGTPSGLRILIQFRTILANVGFGPFIAVAVITAAFMMSAQQQLAHDRQLEVTGFETMGTITATRCETKQWVWYRYAADGREYTGGCRHDQCRTASIGDTIHIYYEPEEPTDRVCGSIVSTAE